MTDDHAQPTDDDERQILELERTLGTDVIRTLAQAARAHDVMIAITVTPYADDAPEGTDRGSDDR